MSSRACPAACCRFLPFVVLFAIFFWTFLWGLFGTFIGVPIALAILTFCAQHPSSRWLADLLGGPVPSAVEPETKVVGLVSICPARFIAPATFARVPAASKQTCPLGPAVKV